jgi:hypothetical protein
VRASSNGNEDYERGERKEPEIPPKSNLLSFDWMSLCNRSTYSDRMRRSCVAHHKTNLDIIMKLSSSACASLSILTPSQHKIAQAHA